MENAELKPSPMLGWMLRDGFKWDDRTLQIINSRRRIVGPALQVESSRSAVIRAARRSYRALDGRNQRICSERAWVNDSLREHGLQLLANDEATSKAIGEQPGEVPQAGEVERRIVIQQAKNYYANLPAELQATESEGDWINKKLRENGLGKLTADELREWNIWTG